tara:strand:+ start:1151 stop:1426 length:276 start_codon:yes stop_codon:yes gene_type:complete
MKRWVVIQTVGSGYTQKYAPPMVFFKRFADAEKYLRAKIKEQIDFEKERYAKDNHRHRPSFDSIKEFLEHRDLYQFETIEGEFFLEQVVFE